MDESLSDMLKEKEELDLQMQVLQAIGRIVERTPGANNLEEAAELTGRPWLDLLVEETGLAPEVAERVATQPME